MEDKIAKDKPFKSKKELPVYSYHFLSIFKP